MYDFDISRFETKEHTIPAAAEEDEVGIARFITISHKLFIATTALLRAKTLLLLLLRSY
jgi:hypothetical protein